MLLKKWVFDTEDKYFFFLPLPIPQYSSYKSNVHRLSSHDYAYSIPENKLDTRIGIVLHTKNNSNSVDNKIES